MFIVADLVSLKQLFCKHFGCYIVIAGSNTFYMKIDDTNKFSVTSWHSLWFPWEIFIYLQFDK